MSGRRLPKSLFTKRGMIPGMVFRQVLSQWMGADENSGFGPCCSTEAKGRSWGKNDPVQVVVNEERGKRRRISMCGDLLPEKEPEKRRKGRGRSSRGMEFHRGVGKFITSSAGKSGCPWEGPCGKITHTGRYRDGVLNHHNGGIRGWLACDHC